MLKIKINANSEKPLFEQVADIFEEDILMGKYTADEPILSTTQISKLYKVNPATAIRGVNILVDKGILYKKRGIGMYVTDEALGIIRKERKSRLKNRIIKKLVAECKRLEVSKNELIKLIEEDFDD